MTDGQKNHAPPDQKTPRARTVNLVVVSNIFLSLPPKFSGNGIQVESCIFFRCGGEKATNPVNLCQDVPLFLSFFSYQLSLSA